MPYFIFAAVLTAAMLDAVQHSLIKSGHDPFARALAVAIAGGVLALPCLAYTGLPAPESWPLLIVSVSLGTLYWLALGLAYQGGTLAMVFPLSRGSAVVLTAIGGHVVLGDRLTTGQNQMLGLMVVGLCLVAFSLRPRGGALRRIDLLPTAGLALITSGFTLVDAAGVRLAGSSLAYCLAIYLGNAIGIGLYVSLRFRGRLATLPRAALPGIAASALMSVLSYALVLYAMQNGPVAIVAALAETSIVFAALLGIFWLREGTSPSHSAGLAAIAAGVILLRLGPWVSP
jgi:uncharacterized membrane protein